MQAEHSAHAGPPLPQTVSLPHMSPQRTKLPQDAPIMFNADRIAFERRVLSQAAFLSASTVSDLLTPARAPRFPAPAEELVLTRKAR